MGGLSFEVETEYNDGVEEGFFPDDCYSSDLSGHSEEEIGEPSADHAMNSDDDVLENALSEDSVGAEDTDDSESEVAPAVQLDCSRRTTTKADLVKWATANDIRRKAARNEILEVMRNFEQQELRILFKDFQTLFGDYIKASIKDLGNDESFCYLGISFILNHPGVYKPVLRQLDAIKSCVVDMILNVDGLPVFRSSRYEFWPLLGKVAVTVFLIGFYFGPGKPTESNNLLYNIVDEMIMLESHGIRINGRSFAFRLKHISADANFDGEKVYKMPS